MPRKSEVLRLRIEPDVLDELREHARAEHRTLAGQVRAALAFYLETHRLADEVSADAGSGRKST